MTLTRLSDAELEARIEAATLGLIDHYGGMAKAVEALRSDPDPQWRPMADFLAERPAEDASGRRGMSGHDCRWPRPAGR